jgi:NAD(P)-dependent dehydrogenase (short-subunit alcohol dehydrogenase family)
MTKNVFITGGTSGIGKSLIYKFAKHGFNIFFTYFNNLNEARSISKNLKKYNIRNNYVRMNLARVDTIKNAFKKFSKKFKKLNIFINNASIKAQRKNFLKLNNLEISDNIKGLLIGNIVLLKKALELSLKNNSIDRTIIVNISSYSAISGGKDMHLYALSKSALNTLVTALSKDTFKKKIKIVSIIPRYIDTSSFRRNHNIKNNKDLISFQKRKKIKKIKTPSEFANFIYKQFVKKSTRTYKSVIYYDYF